MKRAYISVITAYLVLSVIAAGCGNKAASENASQSQQSEDVINEVETVHETGLKSDTDCKGDTPEELFCALSEKELEEKLILVDWDNDGENEYILPGSGKNSGMLFDMEDGELIYIYGYGPYGDGKSSVVFFEDRYWVYEESGKVGGSFCHEDIPSGYEPDRLFTFHRYDGKHRLTETLYYIVDYDSKEYRYRLGKEKDNAWIISQDEFETLCGDENSRGGLIREPLPKHDDKDTEFSGKLLEAIKDFHDGKKTVKGTDYAAVPVEKTYDRYTEKELKAMSPDELFNAFLNEDILAENKEGDWQFSSYDYYIDGFLYAYAGINGQMDRLAEQVDLDNDGEPEFLMNGSYGLDCYDCKDGKVVLFAEGEGTAGICSYTYYKGNTWIVHGDTSHGGREQYYIDRYNGDLNIEDRFYLADWWNEDEVHSYYYLSADNLAAKEKKAEAEGVYWSLDEKEDAISEKNYNRLYEEVFRPRMAQNTFYDFLNGGYATRDEHFADGFEKYKSDMEYLFLDLDGDHVDELLLRADPGAGCWNYVFHYENGDIVCWHEDVMEESSVDYPLLNSTMVYEYIYADEPLRKVYRFLPDGKTQEIIRFFSREVDYNNPDAKCPYYSINDIEVGKDEYYEKLSLYIEDMRIPDSMWKAVG